MVFRPPTYELLAPFVRPVSPPVRVRTLRTRVGQEPRSSREACVRLAMASHRTEHDESDSPHRMEIATLRTRSGITGHRPDWTASRICIKIKASGCIGSPDPLTSQGRPCHPAGCLPSWSFSRQAAWASGERWGVSFMVQSGRIIRAPKSFAGR